MTSITDILAMEPRVKLPNGYWFEPLYNGEVFITNSHGDWCGALPPDVAKDFAAAMNTPTQEAILGKKLAEAAKEVLNYFGRHKVAIDGIEGLRAALKSWEELK